MKPVLELHNEDIIVVYDPENPPQPAKPGQPCEGYFLRCTGRYDEKANTIWIKMIGPNPIPMPLGFAPTVKDFRYEG